MSMPMQAFKVSDLAKAQLQSLFLVFDDRFPPTVECGDGIADDAPIKQLEEFGVISDLHGDERTKHLDAAVAEVRQANV